MRKLEGEAAQDDKGEKSVGAARGATSAKALRDKEWKDRSFIMTAEQIANGEWRINIWRATQEARMRQSRRL